MTFIHCLLPILLPLLSISILHGPMGHAPGPGPNKVEPPPVMSCLVAVPKPHLRVAAHFACVAALEKGPSFFLFAGDVFYQNTGSYKLISTVDLFHIILLPATQLFQLDATGDESSLRLLDQGSM